MNPVIAPPLEAGQTFKLAWLDRVNDTGLGVTYSDFEGHEYTSTLGGEQTRAYEGHLLSHVVRRRERAVLVVECRTGGRLPMGAEEE